MIDDLSFRILQYCCDDFRPIKLLIDKSTSKSALYRRKNMLCEKGWLQTNGKDRYHTTEEGLQQLHSLLGETPEGLSAIYPPLTQVPTPYHTAAIELAVAAVIARQNDLRPDRHPSIILAGPTLRWKTSAAIFLCYTLGLDPSTHIVNLAAEYGKSLWLRKTPTGEISYKRDLLEAPLVVFDEFQNADPECRRLLKIWMDGRKVLPRENEKLTLQATSFITLNPREGQTLEERIGLERAQIRRCIIGDLTDIEIPDLAIKGEEIVKVARAHGPLMLPKPRHDCTQYKAKMYELLSHTLNETERELVDLETLVMLSTAMTAFMEPEEAIRRVFYDTHLLYRTLGWTLPDWQLHIISFPRTPPRDMATGTTSIPATIPDQKCVDAFKLLDSGCGTIDLITRLGFPFEEAHRYAKEYADLKSLDLKTRTKENEDPTVEELKRQVQIAELELKKKELLKPIETDKTLIALSATLEASGSWKQEHCSNMVDDHCKRWPWKERPDVPYQVGEPVLKKRRWFIRPTHLRCAVCSEYHERNTATTKSLELRLSAAKRNLNGTDSAIATLNIVFNDHGKYKKQRCSHLQDGYCMYYRWSQRPSDALTVGQSLQKDTRWYIQPTNTFCALCPDYNEKGKITIQALDATVKDIQKIIEATPTSNLKVNFRCSNCGSKDFLAVKIQCTKCKAEDWWGWHPPK